MPESASTERALGIGLVAVTVLSALSGLALGGMLVLRTVRPIERLTLRLRQDGPGAGPDLVGSDPEIAMLGDASETFHEGERSRVRRESAFLREASHELRTPISIIRAVCELVEGRTPDADEMGRIRRSVVRMENTVEGLLALARGEASLTGGGEFDEDWGGVIRDFQDGTSIEVRQDVAWHPMEPLAARMLVLILGALLRNVAEHSSARSVSVTLSDRQLEVRDDGQGIAEVEEVRTALEKLHPLPDGGLGLPLVARICRRMGWSLELENILPGFRAKISIRDGTGKGGASVERSLAR